MALIYKSNKKLTIFKKMAFYGTIYIDNAAKNASI